MAATMETINFSSLPVHQFGTVTRWIVMYPDLSVKIMIVLSLPFLSPSKCLT